MSLIIDLLVNGCMKMYILMTFMETVISHFLVKDKFMKGSNAILQIKCDACSTLLAIKIVYYHYH